MTEGTREKDSSIEKKLEYIIENSSIKNSALIKILKGLDKQNNEINENSGKIRDSKTER